MQQIGARTIQVNDESLTKLRQKASNRRRNLVVIKPEPLIPQSQQSWFQITEKQKRQMKL